VGDAPLVGDEVDTVIERPGARTGTAVPSASTSPAQASARAIADVEAERLRGLMTGMCASSVVTAAIVFALGGDPLASRTHGIALALTAIASGIAAALLRHPKPAYVRLAFYVGVAQIGVLLTGYYFWGVFSAYGALVPVTMYIGAGNVTKGQAIAGTVACVLAQAGFGLATVLGWIESRGLVEPNATRTGLATQLVALAMIQGVTVGAMVAGRAARKNSEQVLEAHNRALVDLARREAQLAEAYADARAAREGDKAGLGRFSDQTIDGYRLGSVLGRGAMGEVYEGTRVSDGAPVAMKILAPHLLRDPHARDRFLRESRIVSAVDSPHIVRVLAVSQDDALLPYIVMERLDGVDLAQHAKRHSMLPREEVLAVIRQLAEALDAAHARGIIHRDLKPSNVFAVAGEPRTWKLLDFGASRWQDGEGTLTQNQMIGTPGYMAPEQVTGDAVDRRCDVYAFGALIYRLLTGVPAVMPADTPVMLQEVVYRMPVQPRLRAPQISDDVELVLAVALAKKPGDRFDTAGELRAAMEAAFARKLDPAIAARGARIRRQTPWGAWIDGRNEDS
jgi:tRNA A-37 threonylcarbamoyl transferase component Bud32